MFVQTGCKADTENKSQRCNCSTLQTLYLHCGNRVMITDLYEEKKLLDATIESIILPERCKCQISVSLFTVICWLDKTNVHTELFINNSR